MKLYRKISPDGSQLSLILLSVSSQTQFCREPKKEVCSLAFHSKNTDTFHSKNTDPQPPLKRKSKGIEAVGGREAANVTNKYIIASTTIA